jgi:hypothetical protein
MRHLLLAAILVVPALSICGGADGQVQHAAATAKAVSPTPSAPPTICPALSNAVEASEKELARIDAEDRGDNSAPRSSMRATKKAYEATMIGSNLALMRDHHCSPYPWTVSDSAFMLPAMECRTAMLKIETKLIGDPKAKVELPAECDSSKWTRLGEK